MSFYDEIELEDLTYHPATQLYTYPCPCGDQFEISLADMRDGEEVAMCPSCSLQVRVIFDVVSLCFLRVCRLGCWEEGRGKLDRCKYIGRCSVAGRQDMGEKGNQ